MGTGPVPSTFVTMALARNVVKRAAKSSANSLMAAEAWGSLARSPSAFRMDALRLAAESGDGFPPNAISGVGTLGVGGATGDGTAAKLGYQFKPGVRRLAAHVLHALETGAANAWATAAGTPACAIVCSITGWSAGPTTDPPVAVTELITTPFKVAMLRHVATARATPAVAACRHPAQLDQAGAWVARRPGRLPVARSFETAPDAFFPSNPAVPTVVARVVSKTMRDDWLWAEWGGWPDAGDAFRRFECGRDMIL